ncbi:MAG: DNA primase [Spirochaetes bacterium]|nr:DNA primase [Spirochaetota bacterium]
MYISRDIIDLVRVRADIVDIVQKYVPSLKKKGKDYIGLCPFHKEKTPSFSVSQEKQMFYCFSCQAGGNVFSFISKIERLDFPDSVKFLADLTGIEIGDSGKTESPEIDTAVRMNSSAVKLFHQYLLSPAGRPGMEYLKGRGVTRESIDAFNLGFAPDSWDFLTAKLMAAGGDPELGVRFGLVSSSTKDVKKRYYDRFRKRIIFPIYDAGNRPVAFGGRIVGDGEPKYLNSPESELFKKRQVLYGFNIAREHIRDLKRAIIVEGYLDVIGCHQQGLQNVIAPLGTALTEEHLSFLARFSTEVILIFDADSAGEAAALRALSKIGEVNVDLRIGLLPESDPFDFVLKRGVREFMAVVDSSMKPVEYQLDRIAKAAPKKGKLLSMLDSFAVVKGIPYETERSIYLKKISSLLSIEENLVRKDFSSFLAGKGESIQRRGQLHEAESKANGFITRTYRDLVRLLCNHPALIEKAAIDFSEDDIADTVTKSVFSTLVKLYNSDDSFSVDKMFDFFNHGQEMDFLTNCLNSDYTFDDPDAVYTEIYINLRIHEIDEKISSFVSCLKSGNNDHDEYLAEVEVLKREKEKLQNYMQNKHTH